MQKNFDAFVKELAKTAMDVNQPDSMGRLPLLEAVRIKEPRFVDALIQYGAFAKAKDPATGSSPIHLAFQQNMPLVSKPDFHGCVHLPFHLPGADTSRQLMAVLVLM